MVAVLLGADTGPVAGGSLVVDAKADWAGWTYAAGTLELTEDGQVRPRFYRKNINACLDAAAFSWVDKQQRTHVGGVRNAGSDVAAAARIIDGDLSTSWGPQRADGPGTWWVEIDLGRMVTATSLILRFAEEADPFEEFKVYTSDGTPAFVSAAVGDAPDYQTVASVTKPNQERILEYPLRDAYNSDVQHRSVRYVYLEMTAWRDPEANPRLAELEVMALGDNIVSGTLARGGDITAYSAGGIAAELIDGDGTSFWESSRWQTFPEAHWYFHVNLGARFWVDRIVLVCYPPGILGNDVTPPIHHRLEVSDGVPQPGMAEAWEAKGPYVWSTVDQVSQNPPPGT
ncbi:MAG: discoidin domain-containing protein, partial [Candidatus Latescibacterota bacterium]